MNAHRLAWRAFSGLVLILALAFVLRLYRLDAVPLRGDEAFAVRYWAADPLTVTRDLAPREPHPLLSFYAFYGWKQLAGDSVFAMRYLPLLGSLLGVAAISAVARRLFHDPRVTALAALLWALHPFAIWHAQDVRNYALWSGLSPLALAALLRALARDRWRDWAVYLLAAVLAFYSFFLELFLLPLHALALGLLRNRLKREQTELLRANIPLPIGDFSRPPCGEGPGKGGLKRFLRPSRRAIARALLAWSALLLLLIPWLLQAWYLSRSGYAGATSPAAADRLFTWLLPTLLIGDAPAPPWDLLLPLGWLALAVPALRLTRTDRRAIVWCVAWIGVPLLLLFVAATRIDVFHPRYLLASAPAFALLTARALIPASPLPRPYRRLGIAIPLLIALVPLYGLATLRDYYAGVAPKAPDWPALAAYLQVRAGPADLIVLPAPDPAFGYYFRGRADEMALVPEASAPAQLRAALNFYPAIWLIGHAPEAEQFLADHFQRISDHAIAQFSVRQFRQWVPRASELQTPSGVIFAEANGDPLVRLRGYTVLGPDPAVRAITVLLYWEPLRQAATDYTVFVHLTGDLNPAAGGQLWDQDDHPPLYGFAPTTAWEPGLTYRDPYHLLERPEVVLPPGTYTIAIGLYDPVTGTRLDALAPDGTPLGDHLPLLTLDLP